MEEKKIINDGGPAFPCGILSEEWNHGMTLRDWFAGQALKSTDYSYSAEFLAGLAYEIADEMLEKREKHG